MRRIAACWWSLCLLSCSAPLLAEEARWALALHGGAGTMAREQMSAEQEAEIRADLAAALEAGATRLKGGADALDAVVEVVRLLEDSPHFNAGRGAVFNAEGGIELDAALMEGHTRKAGAIAGVRLVRNPVLLARGVMERSPHVLLIGSGAEAFAREIGIEFAEESWFRTEARWHQYLKFREGQSGREAGMAPAAADRYFGTVGAVALDRKGRLAAATSTGGMTGKRHGRVGDVPIIGAGTYADLGCAVSATGWGEYFIRLHIAGDLCARMRYGGQSLQEASSTLILRELPALGGNGGLIAIDRDGRISMPFNTSGMYRAAIDGEGRRTLAVFAEEEDSEE